MYTAKSVHRFTHLTRATVWAHHIGSRCKKSASFTLPHTHLFFLMSWLNVPYRPFPRMLSSPSAVLKTLSVYHSHGKKSVQQPMRTRSLEGVWSPDRFRPKQVMSPSSPTSSATRLGSTRRSTSPTATSISCAQTTPQRFSAVEDVCRIPKHSAAAKKAADSRVSSLFGHFRLGKLSACHVSSCPGPQKTEVELDRESVATTLFSSQSKGKRDRELNFAHALRDRENKRSLNGKLTWPSEERKEKLSKDYSKLRQTWRREIGKREILISHFRRSIKNVNLSDFSYIKQVMGRSGSER